MTVVSNTSEALNSPYTNALEHMLAETRTPSIPVSKKLTGSLSHMMPRITCWYPLESYAPIQRRRSPIFSVLPAPSTCRSPFGRAARLYQARQAAMD